MRAPPQAARAATLAEETPAGFLSPLGWSEATPTQRAHAILRDIDARIIGASFALHACTVGSAAERSAALHFIGHAMREDARLLRRALAVLSSDEGDAP